MSGRILQGDAREALSYVSDSSLEMVITSPPYNVGIEYDGHDDGMDWDDWVALVREVLFLSWAKLIPGGRMAVNVVAGAGRSPLLPVGHTVEGIMLDLPRAHYRGPIVWYKRGTQGNSAAWGSFDSPSNPVLRGVFEMVYVMSKGSPERRDRSGRGDLPAGMFMRHALDVWEIPPAVQRMHPVPFPVELVRRLLQFYTWPGDHVLDPFAGSGVTGVAAEHLGRDWTCIEISPTYCEVIRNMTMVFEGIPTADIEVIE